MGIKIEYRRKKANFLGSQVNPFIIQDLGLKGVKDSFYDNSQLVATFRIKDPLQVNCGVIRVNTLNLIILVDSIHDNSKEGH